DDLPYLNEHSPPRLHSAHPIVSTIRVHPTFFSHDAPPTELYTLSLHDALPISLVLPDGTPMFESAAILIHLTDAHPTARLAPVAGSTAHAGFLQWMLFLSSSVYEAALRIYYPERYSSAGQAAGPQIKAQALADYSH